MLHNKKQKREEHEILFNQLKKENNELYNSIVSENFDFNDNYWNFGYVCKHYPEGKNYHISFYGIRNAKFRNTVKIYFLYLLSTGAKVQSVVSSIKIFNESIAPYMERSNISSLSDFDRNKFKEYLEWLKGEGGIKFRRSGLAKKERLSNLTLYKKSNELQRIAEVAINKNWNDKPKETLIIDKKLSKYWEVSKNINERKVQDRSIPNKIFQKFISKIYKEPDYLTEHKHYMYIDIPDSKKSVLIKSIPNVFKYAILIQATTGMRASEILSLDFNCVWSEESYGEVVYWLERYSEKTEPEPTKRKILISKETFKLVKNFQKINKYFIETSGINKLFVCYSERLSKFKLPSVTILTTNLKELSKKYKLKKDRKEYLITSHAFRHTYAKQLIENGVPLRIIQRHYAHVSIDMTIHYVKIHQDRLEKEYVGTFLDSTEIYANGKQGEDFKKLIEHIGIKHNLDEVINTLTKRFGINPLPMGMCLMDFKKGHCSNTGSEGCYFSECGDFVTNDSFLPNFTRQKELIDKEIIRTKDNKFATMTFEANKEKSKKLNKIIQSLKATGTYNEEESNG